MLVAKATHEAMFQMNRTAWNPRRFQQLRKIQACGRVDKSVLAVRAFKALEGYVNADFSVRQRDREPQEELEGRPGGPWESNSARGDCPSCKVP